MINVVNPGSINIADQGGPPTLVNQAVQVGPSTDAGPVVQVADQGGRPATVDQSVKVGPSQSAGVAARAADLAPGTGVASGAPLVTPPSTADRTVQAGTYSPQGPNTINTIQNSTVNQVYGSGVPSNVYV